MTTEKRELEIAGLKAHFYSPKTGGKSPTVIAVHGGGWRLLNLDNYRYLGPYLAALVALTEKQPVKAVIGAYGVYDMAAQWRHDQLTRPRDHIVERFLGASLLDDRRLYFDASPLSYVSAKHNSTAFLVAWG